jgi:cellulose synthase/poly-beta-1,6-N-acetylglucosamine synthase-like glycosyltransferase
MAWIFWVAFIFLAYTFLGYPLLLYLLCSVRSRPHHRSAIWPTVSFIITAHNEAATLPEKIKNSLDVHYPEEKREIIVASDGSEDATNEIARSFSNRGVKLVAIAERRGKHYAQMIARDAARGEILVFTDVAVRVEPDILEKIVCNFADPSVGCVSSEDYIRNTENLALGERLYVEAEMRLRRIESRVNSLVNLSGSFFAARREVCKDWHPETSADFFLALHANSLGLRAVVDPECLACFGAISRQRSEFYRKVRTIVHGIDVLSIHRELLNPLRHGMFSWQLFSHKLCRWLVPFALLLLLLGNPFLWKMGLLYRLMLASQVALYVTAILGLRVGPLSKFKLFRLAGFFLLGNAATATAWLKFCSGEKYVSWQPSQRN